MSALIKALFTVLFLLLFGVALELLFDVKQTKTTLCLAIAFIALMKSYEALDAGK